MNYVASSRGQRLDRLRRVLVPLSVDYPVAKVLNSGGYYTLRRSTTWPWRWSRPRSTWTHLAGLPAPDADQRLHRPRPADLSAVLVRVHDRADRREPEPRTTRRPRGKRQSIADFEYYSICQGQKPDRAHRLLAAARQPGRSGLRSGPEAPAGRPERGSDEPQHRHLSQADLRPGPAEHQLPGDHRTPTPRLRPAGSRALCGGGDAERPRGHADLVGELSGRQRPPPRGARRPVGHDDGDAARRLRSGSRGDRGGRDGGSRDVPVRRRPSRRRTPNRRWRRPSCPVMGITSEWPDRPPVAVGYCWLVFAVPVCRRLSAAPVGGGEAGHEEAHDVRRPLPLRRAWCRPSALVGLSGPRPRCHGQRRDAPRPSPRPRPSPAASCGAGRPSSTPGR